MTDKRGDNKFKKNKQMKKSLSLILAIGISISVFAQKKEEKDSTLSLPPVVTLRFTTEQLNVFNAILDNQDLSHKAWSDFVIAYNRQLQAQLIKVPAKKDTVPKGSQK